MAAPEETRKVRKRNTEIVINALRNLEPTSLNEIVKYISDTQKVDAAQIREPVREVLERGVKYGFVERVGGKYSLQVASPGQSEDDGEQVDASRRRRRRRSRSRRRRSRSRRRR